MTTLSIQPTFPIFTDIDGQPLEAGLIWIGVTGLDPITNPINAYWDAALTQLVAQPVSTRGGYPLNGSAPGRLYVNSDYSIRVANRTGSTVYSATAATERYSDVVVQVDSSDVTFLQAGTGAVTRTAQAKMRDVVSVKDFGAVGDGVTDDTVAFQNAIAAASGKALFISSPSNAYKITSGLTIPTGTSIIGDNKWKCKILCGANINLLTMQDSSSISGVYLEGNATTGVGIQIPSGQNNQSIIDCRIINFDSGASAGVLNFADNTAGSRMFVSNVEMWQTNGITGSGKYAVYIPNVISANAIPRKFDGIETAGLASFYLGGCNNLYIVNSFIGDLAYTSNSRAALITNTRVLNQTSLTVDGANHILQGNIFPQITLAATLTNSVIGPFSNNNPPIIDNTPANNSVQTFQYRWLYTPTLSSGGVAPVLGNGSIAGYYSRIGAAIFVVVTFQLGSTTTLGTGALRFGLPVSKPDGEVICGGGAVINIGGTLYTANIQIPGAVAYFELIRDTSGSVTAASPGAFGTGDTIRVSFTYNL